MKKLFSGIAFLLSLVAFVGVVYTYSKVQNAGLLGKGDATTKYVDSVATETVQNMINPLFSSVDEVLVFRDLSSEGEAIDAEFNLMPEELLKTVAGTIIKREGHASKRSIIYEYRANRSVYDNLPAPATDTAEPIEKDPGCVEGNPATTESKGPSGEVRYTQKDTTIDGKSYKMHTKTDVTYETN